MIGIKNMECINFTCQGESHKADNKVCQDYSATLTESGLTVAVVCDGHGGNRYFRSDIGSRYATEITMDCIRYFVNSIDPDLFEGKPYTSIGPISELEVDYKETAIDNAFRQLFSSIICRWNEKISEHAANTPLTEWESANVHQKYLDEFVLANNLEKTYGCTLMAFAITKTYWFAFHIGDGKCISIQESPLWTEPIPWDERCFLNKTTSLCDSNAINEFRYSYQGDGSFPIAVFLGSDGVDDSFGETTNMVNFYIQLAKEIVSKSKEAALIELQETLPELSLIGSKDDMSVACIYDITRLNQHLNNLIQWQVSNINNKVEATNNRIIELQHKLRLLQNDSSLSDKERIERKYTLNDLDRMFLQKRNQVKKLDRLLRELHKEDFIPYNDEIGVDNKLDNSNEEIND